MPLKKPFKPIMFSLLNNNDDDVLNFYYNVLRITIFNQFKDLILLNTIQFRSPPDMIIDRREN